MKTLGNVVHIQRGETWSLDFDVSSVNGAPYMLFKEWRHPYLVITVTAARYEQKGDFRQTWWLDMDQRYVEQADGTMVLVPMKRFIETQPLYTQYHAISQVMTTYGEPYGRITATGNKNDPFDVTNYLFFTDPDADGNNSYKYVSDYETVKIYELAYENYSLKQFSLGDVILHSGKFYVALVNTSTLDVPGSSGKWLEINGSVINFVEGNNYYLGDVVVSNDKVYVMTQDPYEAPPPPPDSSYWLQVEHTISSGGIISETWEEYNFRIIKQFNTKSWTEQNYLFDMKVLAGETVAERVQGILVEQGLSDFPPQPWSDAITNQQIARITSNKTRKEMQGYQDSGAPLMPDFDTKSLILEPTKLMVSANIQGGVR